MNSQTLFTNTLRAAVEARGLVLVVDHDYSNTGTFRVALPNSLAFVLEVRFSFQTDYATFKNSAGGLDLPYTVPGRYAEALDKIVALLPPPKRASLARVRASSKAVRS